MKWPTIGRRGFRSLFGKPRSRSWSVIVDEQNQWSRRSRSTRSNDGCNHDRRSCDQPRSDRDQPVIGRENKKYWKYEEEKNWGGNEERGRDVRTVGTRCLRYTAHPTLLLLLCAHFFILSSLFFDFFSGGGQPRQFFPFRCFAPASLGFGYLN